MRFQLLIAVHASTAAALLARKRSEFSFHNTRADQSELKSFVDVEPSFVEVQAKRTQAKTRALWTPERPIAKFKNYDEDDNQATNIQVV